MSDETTRIEAIHQPALPAGTRMGDFELGDVLGAGGFGIVYAATDHALGRRVAIKEYMPAFLAGRTSDGQITLLSQSNRTTFEAGLRSFVEEARLLAGLDHASLVKVFQFWKANGTAYFVMPFYDGHTLTHHRRVLHTRFDEKRLRELLDGMLGALDVLHAQNIVHRDVAPDNFLLVDRGRRPVLLDFGSARRTIEGQTRKLTVVIKLGYAPIEQYDDTRAGVQGPWTDLYALGGTLHFLITGHSPPPAQMRALADEFRPLADAGAEGCSRGFLRIVDWMLALRPSERPQNVRQVRDALRDLDTEGDTVSTGHVDVDIGSDEPSADPLLANFSADRTRSWVSPTSAAPAPAAQPARRHAVLWGAALLALAGAAAGAAWLQWRGDGAVTASQGAAAASAALAAVPAASAAASAAPAAATAVVDAASAVAAAASAAAAAPEPVAPPASVPAVAAVAPPAATVAPAPKAAASKPLPPAQKPAPVAQKAPPPAAEKSDAGDAARGLSPDMAAALARAQAAQRIIDSERGKPEAPAREVPMPAIPVVIESSGPAAPAPGPAAADGATSPLARCRNEQSPAARRACFEAACASPDFRFHAVCVRLQREGAERPRTGR